MKNLTIIHTAHSELWDPDGGVLRSGLDTTGNACLNELLNKMFGDTLILKFEETTKDWMKALLSQLGKISDIEETVEVLEKLVTTVEALGGIDAQTQIIIDQLEERLGVPNDLLEHMIKRAVAEASGDCQTVTMDYKSDTTSTKSGRTAAETASCEVLVCAKMVPYGPFGILSKIGDWEIYGFCNYQCKGEHCCCGEKATWSYTVKGSGSTVDRESADGVTF